MIKQMKGKEIQKIAKSKLVTDIPYFVSVKYDGNYVQIHKQNNEVRFVTSGGKEFYLKDVAEELISRYPMKDFILEAEYVVGEGKLGDRVRASTGSYRANFTKGIKNNIREEGKLMVFNRIFTCSHVLPTSQQELRDTYTYIETEHIVPVTTILTDNLEEARIIAKDLHSKGWEGAMAVASTRCTYDAGKRVNDIIKIKPRPTAKGIVKEINLGQGKYDGMIGALVLEIGSSRVTVGSGLTDEQRLLHPADWIGVTVEISYETRSKTGEFIQPTVINVDYTY